MDNRPPAAWASNSQQKNSRSSAGSAIATGAAERNATKTFAPLFLADKTKTKSQHPTRGRQMRPCCEGRVVLPSPYVYRINQSVRGHIGEMNWLMLFCHEVLGLCCRESGGRAVRARPPVTPSSSDFKTAGSPPSPSPSPSPSFFLKRLHYIVNHCPSSNSP